VRDAIAPLEEGYADLLAAAVEVVEADDRLVALWLGGSVGRGTADAGSDLDLLVTASEEGAESLSRQGPEVWAALDPVITIALASLPGSFAFTTRAGLRCDVVLETESALAHTPYRHRIAVVDPGGLAARVPGPGDEALEEEAVVAGAERVVTEFLRQSAIFPAAVVAREDWLLGRVAVANYHQLLYDLFVAANQPLPPMGVKQWSARLTGEQRRVLAALPLPAAERASVLEAMVRVREAIRSHGRAAYESLGGAWPEEVDAAIAAYWRRHGLPSQLVRPRPAPPV
jgi:predicted nucleotidyltransferase